MSRLLHSKIIGEGKPLLILHGFLGMSDNWKTLGNQYAEQGFQVHLIDLRNHGKSFHSDLFNYDVLSNDVLHYCNSHDLEKVSIIGHSMGGKVAMQFACDHFNLIEKLVVADIAPKYYPPHHQDIINGLLSLDFKKIGSRAQADEALSKHLGDVGTRQFLLKNLYWVEKASLGFRFNLGVLSNKLEEIGESIGATSHFHGPTLFLKGETSEYVVAADLPEIKRNFPAATIDTIDNSGHWVHAENPKQFFEKSLLFLKSKSNGVGP